MVLSSISALLLAQKTKTDKTGENRTKFHFIPPFQTTKRAKKSLKICIVWRSSSFFAPDIFLFAHKKNAFDDRFEPCFLTFFRSGLGYINVDDFEPCFLTIFTKKRGRWPKSTRCATAKQWMILAGAPPPNNE